MATTIFDLNFNKTEANSTIRILVYANLSSPDDIQFAGYIILDEQIVQACAANIILDTNNSQGRIPLSPFAFLTGVGPGWHNVKFVVENQETDNIALSIMPGATIEVTEIKQGGM